MGCADFYRRPGDDWRGSMTDIQPHTFRVKAFFWLLRINRSAMVGAGSLMCLAMVVESL
jgi:hypothetical protein